MSKRLSLTIVIVAVLSILPLLVDRWISARDFHYDEVVNNHECDRDVCKGDFDGDGVLGRLERTQVSPSGEDRWLIIVDNQRELLRIPYNYIDGTLRTHAALRNENGRTRLLTFDGTRGGDPLIAVFAWDGDSISQVTPSSADNEILTAIGARDDAGTWTEWGMYRAFSLPVLIGYYSLLAGILVGALLVRGLRRAH